jgi:hypothetical protein
MRILLLSAAIFALISSARIATAENEQTFTIGEGKIQLTAPATWTKKEPTSRIVEVEFSIPPTKGDENPGRLTAMGAGGSVEMNVDRWAKQFAGPGGTPPKPRLDKTSVGGAEVVVVDLNGTYEDNLGGGPFAGGKTVKRDNYRMLGAIVQTKSAGNYFLKLYGPKPTIDENEKAFQDMVNSLKVK